MVNVFVVVGDGGTRKSALVRALTGASNRRVYDIEELLSSTKNQFFVQVRSLQEARISPQDFVTEMQNINIFNILTTLRINAINGQPDGAAYINYFVNTARWNLNGIILMGAGTLSGLPNNCPAPMSLNNSTSRAANEMASRVSRAWGWK